MKKAMFSALVLWPAYLGLSLVLDVLGLFVILPLSLARAWELRPTRQMQSGYDRTVLQYDLVALNTMDEEVLERQAGKLSVQDALMKARARAMHL